MKVVFYLKSCNTCTRIIKEIKLNSSFVFREIKSNPLTLKEIEMNQFSIKELNYLLKKN